MKMLSLVCGLVLLSMLPGQLLAEGPRVRVFLPVSESGELDEFEEDYKVSGYVIHGVSSFGVGLGYASLAHEATGEFKLYNAKVDSDLTLRHDYVDLFYMLGDTLTLTLGLSAAVNGSYELESKASNVGFQLSSGSDVVTYESFSSKIEGNELEAVGWFVGLGYSVGSLEVLAQYRTETVKFKNLELKKINLDGVDFTELGVSLESGEAEGQLNQVLLGLGYVF